MNRLAHLTLLWTAMAACTLRPPPLPSDTADVPAADAIDVTVADVTEADVTISDVTEADVARLDAQRADDVTDASADVTDAPPRDGAPPGDAPCGDTSRDPEHCGACENRCALPNAVAGCAAGACTVAACHDGFADCNDNPRDGCEVTLATSTLHCGACGRACAADGGAAMVCAGGVCRASTVTCGAGRGDCDGEAANGCETDLASSVAHCGACGRTCPSVNGTARCAAGVCAVTCAAGFGDCDMNTANGCETRLDAPSDCGSCGRGCALANATAACFAGSCTVRACNAGFGDCDGDPANGCEARLDTSTHCGACGRACTFAGAASTCAGGVCALGACQSGLGNCDGNAANGCETPLDTRANCGACGLVCAAPHASGACTMGRCAPGACDAGWGDCNGVVADGCEADTRGDADNCGACGRACAAGQVCNMGTCQTTCTLSTCMGACVDTASSVEHCGACLHACPSGPNGTASCASSVCGFTCNGGYGDCNGSVGDGCEENLQTSARACGRCGSACALANATPRCEGGACRVASCSAGFSDCDGTASNGCEVNTATDPFHCGACGMACPAVTNGVARCTAGACGVSCNAGYVLSAGACVACGGVGQPVCAGGDCAAGLTACLGYCRDTDYDRLNCGACGFRCLTRYFCNAGGCEPIDTCRDPPCPI